MLYLLDADTFIRADNKFYRRASFPIFWDWLIHEGKNGNIKVPLEQYEEIIAGTGELTEWLKQDNAKDNLVLQEEADPVYVSLVTEQGYAPDLDEAEIIKIGRDPFLIAYGYADIEQRCIVTFEVSAPSKTRANRKIPDVCATFGINCTDLFEVISNLGFTTDWSP